MNNSQCIKLFDRKFAANTLRNCRRCPKCRNEFSHYYDVPDKHAKDVVVNSNRPILLPCGHNLCENCVYNNRQNLTCNVCLKPVELSVTQLRHGTHFHVREHFDLNFYLLGELHNLRFYRKDGSSNSTLLATTQNSVIGISNSLSSVAPSVIKCMECEVVPAIGKCRQCKVYMCKRCFDFVHKGSKVLKIHNLQRLDQECKKTDVERLLKPHFCKRHQRVTVRYCKKCNYFCCTECARNDHQLHGHQSLLELNKNNADGIIVTLDNVKASRENLRKSLKVRPKIQTSRLIAREEKVNTRTPRLTTFND